MSIINAFLFFNELLQLEIRLNEIYDVVDYFILTESTKTHSGKDKHLFYKENKERFKKFWPKIIHNVVTDTPPNYNDLKPESEANELKRNMMEKVLRADWFDKSREDYVRITFESECHIRAMEFCKPDDIIILDEADEIPRRNVIEQIPAFFDPKEIYNLENRMYFYYLNCQKEEKWYGSTILTFENYKKYSLCEMRMRRRGYVIPDAGWHFSYCSSSDGIRYKIESHAEQMLNTDHIKDNIQKNIDECLINGRDIYFRPAKFSIVPIDESYPDFVVKNQDQFRKDGYIK